MSFLLQRRSKHLKLLGETLHVVLVELHDVFDEVLHRDGLHVVCKRKQCTLSLYIPEGQNGRQAGAVAAHGQMKSRCVRVKKNKKTK